MKLTLSKREEDLPVCPECNKQLDDIWFRELKGDLGKRIVYFCPKCKIVLGISHRKGLAMGL